VDVEQWMLNIAASLLRYWKQINKMKSTSPGHGPQTAMGTPEQLLLQRLSNGAL
jgi:hypothetical protein